MQPDDTNPKPDLEESTKTPPASKPKEVVKLVEGTKPEMLEESAYFKKVGLEAGDEAPRLTDETLKPKKKRGKFFVWKEASKRKKALLVALGVFTLFVLVMFGMLAISALKAQSMMATAKQAQFEATTTYTALKGQDLATGKQSLNNTHQKLVELQSSYGSLGFWSFTPARWHYQDGKRALNAAVAGVEAAQIMVEAIEPYADVIGFTGEGSFMGGTAEERIVKVVETLDKVTPSLDAVEQKLHIVNQELAGINPKRYPFALPESVKTKLPVEAQTVSELIAIARTQIGQAEVALDQARPAIEQLPKVAGVDQPKTYLVLFQNDGELRPTGGFMTAYAVLKVDKGKIEPVKSDDIYELDNAFRSTITPPPAIKKYLPAVPVWNLRDMNLSPDFKVSMDEFISHYQTIKGEPQIDGIIAVDTNVLTKLIETLGPVEVPGYGTFTTETVAACDCPQVVYQLENMITRPTPYHRSDRKGVLGPLMQTILQKAFGAPKQIYPALFQTASDAISRKHVLFYFNDPQAQAAAEAINVAGRMRPFEGDFIHVNDANFGGAKSNMFVTEEVEQEITVGADGAVTKKVTIAYKNPRKGDNCNLEAGQLCLNGVLPSYTRIYLPKGSQLTEALGFDDNTVNVSDDLDKTVIEGFFKLNPQSQAKIILTYSIPYKPQDTYNLYVQKQPGKDAPEYTVSLSDYFREEFALTTDKTLSIKLQ
jgi:hypothetical protein